MNISLAQPSSQTTILLIEPDDDARPALVTNLQNRGYRVIVTVTPEDAQEWAKQCSQPPDLILCNQVAETIEGCLKKAQVIRQELAKPSRTPIVILAERYGCELEGQNIHQGDNSYVAYLENAQQLFDLLVQLCS